METKITNITMNQIESPVKCECGHGTELHRNEKECHSLFCKCERYHWMSSAMEEYEAQPKVAKDRMMGQDTIEER